MQGSNHDDVRRHNLSAVLRLVHASGAASRAELTHMSGLNRSTIGALVTELAELGLVEEKKPEATNRVGRPSPMVSVSERVVVIAVNPEIDAVTIGIIGLHGKVHRRIRYATKRSPSVVQTVDIVMSAIDGMCEELSTNFRVVGIGVAVPGLVRSEDGLVRHAPHLGWVDEPFAKMLEDALGYPVYCGNDASLGATAERHFGAGRGINDLIYLNGGASGIGGGIIIGGTPVGGVEGYAGEFGHARVSESYHMDSAGIPGTLEAEVKRRGLLDALGLENADAEELENDLLASKSPTVEAEVKRQLDYLAVALAGAINVLNPKLIILGGFLAALLAVDPARLQNAVTALALEAPFGAVRVKAAELGSNMLLIGAGELVFEHLIDDPSGFMTDGDMKMPHVEGSPGESVINVGLMVPEI